MGSSIMDWQPGFWPVWTERKRRLALGFRMPKFGRSQWPLRRARQHGSTRYDCVAAIDVFGKAGIVVVKSRTQAFGAGAQIYDRAAGAALQPHSTKPCPSLRVNLSEKVP